jgi:hypothetical protein
MRHFLVLVVLAAAGCSLNPSMVMDSYTIRDRRDGTFQMNISPAQYKDLTDAGPPALKAFVNGAVLRRKYCVAGYTMDEPVVQWGHVEIIGRCYPGA